MNEDIVEDWVKEGIIKEDIIKNMDSDIKEFGAEICFKEMICFGFFTEALKIFNNHGDKSYMEVALKHLGYRQERLNRAGDEIKSLKKQLKDCRNDLFNLRKERGDTDGFLKMHMETNHDLDEVPVEDYFAN